MAKVGYLCRFFLSDKCPLSSQIKRLHLTHGLQKNSHATDSYTNNPNVESNLWFTTLPTRKKRILSLEGKKKVKTKTNIPSGPLLISCKRKEFNHHVNTVYNEFEPIPLASKAWHHRKSNGDHFTILPMTQHPAFLVPETDELPHTFEAMGLSSNVIQQLKNMGVENPTTIQAKSIPVILNGKSVLIAAETGCGKTLAYFAPILDCILKWKENIKTEYNVPFAIILVPTRELAIQVGTVANKLCRDLNIKCLTLLGGRTKKLLLDPKPDMVDVLVCTPGVFSKLLTHKVYSLDNCKHLVLDEADTLLDDTFKDLIKRIIRRCKLKFGTVAPSTSDNRQLCLVSATMPQDVEDILHNIIGEEGLEQISTNYLHKIQSHLSQEFLRWGPSKKPEELLRIVKRNVKLRRPTMIFSNKTSTSKWVAMFLRENGIDGVFVNKKMDQQERLDKYQLFKDGHVDVISCTDIASRGLDSTRVKHVINYEFPRFVADYIHRCGRTGRIGHDDNCLVTNFISRDCELPLVRSIEKSARTTLLLRNVDNNKMKLLSRMNKVHESMPEVKPPETS